MLLYCGVYVNPPDGSRRSRRAAVTRGRIVEAAWRHFESRGFEAARIEDVAETADVAVATVYKVFRNKRSLLEAALDLAMTGAPGASVDQQAWWREQLEEPDGRRQLQLIARNARRIYERAGALLEVVRTAAFADAHIASLWRQVSAERLRRSRASITRLATKARLREGLSSGEAALTIWSLTGPELYALRVAIARRSPADYERWLGEILVTAMLEPVSSG